ncbi:hypothetical protein BRCON_2337 [Candidatus Sumerlaea chitinivorans]|uniref:Uncharacterized protein n=1 Tax=Sumerlaea chitinivorans TaxID=2250252 RepID=A0A2Z4Y7A4_SUMC1|nr:hypothetical protein BRCON_2337 [Candidatus Sumerlaea chitinivorans]
MLFPAEVFIYNDYCLYLLKNIQLFAVNRNAIEQSASKEMRALFETIFLRIGNWVASSGTGFARL